MMIYIITVLVVILISMTLHEAMHGFMAYWLGDDTAKSQGRLTLNPIKHIDPFLTIILPVLLAISGAPVFGGAKPVPFNPARVKYGEWGAALVALAGPLTNFILAFISVGLYILFSSNTALSQVMLTATWVNLGFFVFNMIPIPPLDGSRVLYAIAPDGVRRFMESIERAGLMVVFAVVLLASALIGQFMSVAIVAIIHSFLSVYDVFM